MIVLNIDTCETQIKFSYQLSNARNNKIKNDYLFEFEQNDLSDENIEMMAKMLESIYGWIPVFELHNGNKSIIQDIFFAEYDELNGNVSHTFPTNLKPRNLSDKEVLNCSEITVYKVTFNVDDGTNPILNAKIVINPTKKTDKNGIAIFYLQEGSYNYTVNKDGFAESTGNVVLTENTVVDVAMSPPVTNIKNGYLYNWFTTQLSNLFPAGWEMQERQDVIDLYTTLGGKSIAGGKMKYEDAPTYEFWNSPNTGADNSSDFTAYGSGYRLSTGVFRDIKNKLTLLTKDDFFFIVDAALVSNLNYNSVIYDAPTASANIGTPKEQGSSIRPVWKGTGTPTSQITDYDGNIYDVVQIGSQYWLKQNWACTHLNDGTALTKVTDSTAWAALTTEGYCAYDNDENNVFE